MPRRKRSALTPANAIRLVEFLIEEGKVLAHDIARYLKIAELEERLRALRGGEVPVPHSRPKTATSRNSAPRRAVSAVRRESQRIQGLYIANLRRFPKGVRPRYQKIARERGRDTAIAEMKKALGK